MKSEDSHIQLSLLQKILNFYIYSSLHIGLCAFALSWYCFDQSTPSDKVLYCTFVASSTVVLYNLHRLIGIENMHKYKDKGRFAIIVKYKSHIIFYLIIALLISTYTFFSLPLDTMLWVLCPSILSLGYSVPLIGNKRLRDAPGIKIFIIATCWTWLCMAMPMIISHTGIGVTWGSLLACFFYFIGITLPFDIRDKEIESDAGVTTLVTVLGVNGSWVMAHLCIGVSTFCIWITSVSLDAWSITWIVTMGITSLLLLVRRPSHDDWYYSLVLDGTMMLFLICYLILL